MASYHHLSPDPFPRSCSINRWRAPHSRHMHLERQPATSKPNRTQALNLPTWRLYITQPELRWGNLTRSNKYQEGGNWQKYSRNHLSLCTIPQLMNRHLVSYNWKLPAGNQSITEVRPVESDWTRPNYIQCTWVCGICQCPSNPRYDAADKSMISPPGSLCSRHLSVFVCLPFPL